MSKRRKIDFIQTIIEIPRVANDGGFAGFKKYLTVTEVCKNTRKPLRTYTVENNDWENISKALSSYNRYQINFN